jgi:hypothetical protein
MYCWINILFSDKLAEEFGALGNTPTHSKVNGVRPAYEEGFWKKREAAYPVNKLDYKLIHFYDDDVFIN